MKRNYLVQFEALKPQLKYLYKILLIILFTAIGIRGFSQQISASLLCSGGASFVKANQSLEFSIGEIVTETYQTGSNTLTQGFFQGTPEGIGINEDFVQNANVRIFPNPARSRMTVNCDLQAETIEIIDLQGRVLFTKQCPQQKETLNVEHLQSGIYLLRLVFEGTIPITKRIVKN
jgi:hypothetical protein